MTQMSKGQSHTTGTVHYAIADKTYGELVQVCGMNRNRSRGGQVAFLFPTDADVTCRKCQGRTEAPRETQAAPERKTFGRQEWTITDLRQVAAELKIAGRTRMTGDELLAKIIELAPQFA